MKAIKETIAPEAMTNFSFDAFCQGFNGGYFYGLEYILEDLFENTTEKPSLSIPVPNAVDWFGLYQ